jgi:hypothetical protein
LRNESLLTPEERFKIADKALEDAYNEMRKEDPQLFKKKDMADYILMFTEGGEADVVASAISVAQDKKTRLAVEAKRRRSTQAKTNKELIGL